MKPDIYIPYILLKRQLCHTSTHIEHSIYLQISIKFPYKTTLPWSRASRTCCFKFGAFPNTSRQYCNGYWPNISPKRFTFTTKLWHHLQHHYLHFKQQSQFYTAPARYFRTWRGHESYSTLYAHSGTKKNGFPGKKAEKKEQRRRMQTTMMIVRLKHIFDITKKSTLMFS